MLGMSSFASANFDPNLDNDQKYGTVSSTCTPKNLSLLTIHYFMIRVLIWRGLPGRSCGLLPLLNCTHIVGRPATR